MTIAVDLGRKATKTNKQTNILYAYQFLNFNMLFEILMGSLEKLLGIRILNCTLELEQNDFNFLLMGGGGAAKKT